MIAWILHTFILNSVLYLVSTECPQDADRRIQVCIKSTLPNFGLGTTDSNPPHAIKTSIERLRDSCRTKKLESGVTCMQNYLDQCKGTTDREQLLHMLFDKQQIQDSVQYFCASLPVYERHAECISQQHKIVLNCSGDEVSRYRTILMGRPTNDVLMQANCRLHKISTECLIDFSYENCGLEAADFLETVTIGQTPPYCDKREKKYSFSNPGNSACRYTLGIWYFLYTCWLVIK